MRGIVVAIDLETTGLDAQKDKIIEIGAVRMQEGKILEEYATLINPDIPIPDRTTLLTGIKPQDVLGAPRIQDVIDELQAFVGDAPIVGHSVGFDLSFLNRQGLFEKNIPLDTYDLTSVLLPSAPRYNLHSLTLMLDIELEDAHRALDDARASGILYWQMYLKALQLPIETLKTINDAAQGLEWVAGAAFAAAYREKLENDSAQQDINEQIKPVDIDADGYLQPLKPNDAFSPIDLDDVASIFSEDGALSQSVSDYEVRTQQVDMAKIVGDALNQGEHLIIEAGTGTGKSLGYLVPAVQWALKNQSRVVVSTDTIALQDQLMNKDIPLLQQALDIPIRAAVMKGRGNYLCPLQVEMLKRRGPTNVEELRVFAKILVWQLESTSGDKTEITLRGPAEHSIWNRLSSAEGGGCRNNTCRDVLGIDCPVYKAYKRAEAAHIVIVNHALLLSNSRFDDRVLPAYEHLIIDEAHHLEDAITNSLRYEIDEAMLLRRLEDLGNDRRGLFADVVTSIKTSQLPTKTVKRIVDYVSSVSQAADEMSVHVKKMFKAIRKFVKQHLKTTKNEYVIYFRVEPSHRSTGNFERILNTWEILSQFIEVIQEALKEITKFLGQQSSTDIINYDDLLRSTQAASQYMGETYRNLKGFIAAPDPNTIYWLVISQDGLQIELKTAPLHVGDYVTEDLWSKQRSVILTGATLRTNGSFEHLQERLYAESVKSYEVGSPFDYQKSALLYLPTDVAEPREFHSYQQAVEQCTIELAAALNGRVMVLFTSYSHLRQTAKSITPRLALGNIAVYDQSDGASRQSLLEGFKSTEKAVLLGTRSFWEGVDIPGDDLSAVIITRLPFPVPSDPIISARAETYNNSFQDYMVPEAILRFRQGFGRLIRTNKDKGIVVVMDSRIINKGYGANFLDSLPNCTIQKGKLANVATTALQWLGDKS